MQINLVLPCVRVPSINELYRHNYKTGAVYKSPEIVQIFDQMRTYMADNYALSNFKGLTRKSKLAIHFEFVLRRNLGKRDLSNMLKMVEDTVTRYVGVDDSQVLYLSARKSENKKNLLEYVNVSITDTPDMAKVVLDTDPIVIPTNYIYSVNHIYGYNTRSHTVYKRKEVHRAEKEIAKFLSKNVRRSNYPWVNNNNRFRCHYDFFLKQNAGKRDTSNMIKSVEDAIFKFFLTDDSRVLELSARRFELPENSKEYVVFSIQKSTHDITSFNS